MTGAPGGLEKVTIVLDANSPRREQLYSMPTTSPPLYEVFNRAQVHLILSHR